MEYQDPRKAFSLSTERRRFRVTVYTDGLKITGHTAMSPTSRNVSSQRPSDFMRSFPSDYITLSQPTVYCRFSREVLDEPDFIVVKAENICAIHAIDEAGEGEGEADATAGRQVAGQGEADETGDGQVAGRGEAVA